VIATIWRDGTGHAYDDGVFRDRRGSQTRWLTRTKSDSTAIDDISERSRRPRPKGDAARLLDVRRAERTIEASVLRMTRGAIAGTQSRSREPAHTATGHTRYGGVGSCGCRWGLP